MIAAIDKNRENIIPKVVSMLSMLTHPGVDMHGIGTPTTIIASRSIKEIATKNVSSNVAIGHQSICIFSKDRMQPIQGNGFTFVFEGRFFPFRGWSEVDEAIERFRVTLGDASSLIKNLEGSYTFAFAYPSKLVCGRDTFGKTPLYYGEDETLCALASERKALWALGIRNARSFPPGNLAVIDVRGFSFKPVITVRPPTLRDIGMENAAQHLQDLLSKSIEKRIADLKEVAIAFSGGVDSSIIAALVAKHGKDTQLITVGLEDQPEIEFAEKAAEALGLPIYLKTYRMGDVEEILPKVLWLIEEAHPVGVSIAIPFFWIAENVSKRGLKVFLSGQGSDELFGGYHRYLREYAQSGVKALHEIMFRDVAMSYQTNLQRDHQVCSQHRVEMRFPFIDLEVVRFALSLPPSLKIWSHEDPLRKRILRRVARDIGIPTFIAEKAKKAIQYSTGVNKIIKKMAKRERLTTQQFLEKSFRKAYSTMEVSK